MTLNWTVIIYLLDAGARMKNALNGATLLQELLRSGESFAKVRPSESECIQIMIANAARLMRIVISAAEAAAVVVAAAALSGKAAGCPTNKNSDVTAILASVCVCALHNISTCPSSENQKRVHRNTHGKAESVSQYIYTVSLFTYGRLN